MRIVIAGAGAVGGYIGAQLVRCGADVVLFARGPHLAAMQERGLRIVGADESFEVRPKVSGDLSAVGKADLVVLGSNRRRGWQRFREGSVGERVLRRAGWPLLIVPRDLPSKNRERSVPGTSRAASPRSGPPSRDP